MIAYCGFFFFTVWNLSLLKKKNNKNNHIYSQSSVIRLELYRSMAFLPVPPDSRGVCVGILHSSWARWETRRRPHRTRSTSTDFVVQIPWRHLQRWRWQRKRTSPSAVQSGPWTPENGNKAQRSEKAGDEHQETLASTSCTIIWLLGLLTAVRIHLWTIPSLESYLPDKGLADSLVLPAWVGKLLIVIIWRRPISTMIPRTAHGSCQIKEWVKNEN